jgi:hypothetical protein
MCGIAGYNAAPAWVSEYIDEDVQFGILEDAWLHNQHRGTDAAGYFRVDKENLKPYVKKTDRPASNILEDQDRKKISPALVFGAHTRQATLGDPKNPLNNHPVEYRQILVTHNGIISNHESFRAMVPFRERETIGEVDTTAIAIALSCVQSPHQIDEILEVLSDLDGGMAFHAIWKNVPGTSLLARGRGNPLIMRWHPDGFFCYASVDEANYAMIDRMGLDPNDKAWEIRRMDEYSAVIVEDGMPVNWGSYKKKGWSASRNTLDHFVMRVTADTEKTPVFKTDTASHWAAKKENQSLRAAKKAKRTELIFTKKQGFRPDKTKVELPVAATLKPWDKVTEADQVYQNTDSPIIYARYGNIEVIIDSDNSKLLDIYDHGKFPETERRVDVPIEKDVESNDTFDEWVRKATSQVYNPVDKLLEPHFRRARTNPTRGVTILNGPNTPRSSMSSTQGSSPFQNGLKGRTRAPAIHDLVGPNITVAQDEQEPDVFYLHQSVNWDNKNTWCEHKSAPMGFLDDRICPDHHQSYSIHENPEQCETVILASIAWASCISDLSVWYGVGPEVKLLERPKLNEDSVSVQCKGLDGSACNWEPYLWRQIYIGNSNGVDQVVEVLMGEKCSDCGSKFYIEQLPQYMEDWTGDKRYVS